MRRLLTILLLFLPLGLHAEEVTVRLYATATIPSISVSVQRGHYRLYANDTLLIDSTITSKSIIKIRHTKGRVALEVNKHHYGAFVSLLLWADTAVQGILNLAPDHAKARSYEGSLRISSDPKGGLRLVNHVAMETYIAGVVQSEIYGDLTDIYKAQAVISRTWALLNLHKHEAEGYNFCDHVHCQAYHTRCTMPLIGKAVRATAGQVLIDSSNHLIETPFHANSGGETANSEDVWRHAIPYLRSLPDTFSLSMKQSTWEKTIALDRWLQFIQHETKRKINNDSLIQSVTHFSQPHRQANWLGIPLKRFRTEFNLRSTFFDVELDSANRQVLLHGRGFGHGVGLSQEGAIRRAQSGQTYDEILSAYYLGASLSTLAKHPMCPYTPVPGEDTVSTTPNSPEPTPVINPNSTSTVSPTDTQTSTTNPIPKPQSAVTPPLDDEDSDWKFDW